MSVPFVVGGLKGRARRWRGGGVQGSTDMGRPLAPERGGSQVPVVEAGTQFPPREQQVPSPRRLTHPFHARRFGRFGCEQATRGAPLHRGPQQ